MDTASMDREPPCRPAGEEGSSKALEEEPNSALPT